MADINEYLDGLNMKFSEQEKQLLDIFAECWEYCHTHGCRECEYRQGNEYMKMMLCAAYQYAKRLIAADVAPVKHAINFAMRSNEIICSNCDMYINVTARTIRENGGDNVICGYQPKFCPNCGARMDGDADA